MEATSGFILAIIVVGALVAAAGNVALALVREVATKIRSALLILVALFSVIAAVATSVYPSAREREGKERLAHDAKTLLLPEIHRNETRVADMLKFLTETHLPSPDGLDVAAWQTVASGGLLVGLKAEETSQFLETYSMVFKVNNINDKFTDVLMGARGPLEFRDNSMHVHSELLQINLTKLQQAFSKLHKNSQ